MAWPKLHCSNRWIPDSKRPILKKLRRIYNSYCHVKILQKFELQLSLEKKKKFLRRISISHAQHASKSTGTQTKVQASFRLVESAITTLGWVIHCGCAHSIYTYRIVAWSWSAGSSVQSRRLSFSPPNSKTARLLRQGLEKISVVGEGIWKRVVGRKGCPLLSLMMRVWISMSRVARVSVRFSAMGEN